MIRFIRRLRWAAKLARDAHVNATCEGMDAFGSGTLRRQNPYTPDSTEAKWWTEGYARARDRKLKLEEEDAEPSGGYQSQESIQRRDRAAA